MKHIYSLIILISFYSGFSQSLPINFEGDISTSDFFDFNGGTAIVTTNPDPSGINMSTSVGRIIRDGGAIWAGSKILLTDNLDFSVLTKITMKVYTNAPIGTIVKFKLEGSGPAVDVDAVTTVSGAWETLEWVFVGTENNLNEVIFMFDYGNVGDGSVNSTFYFDDVEQVSGPTAPVPTSLPIDFESGVISTDFLNYSGATASIISNPHIDVDNPSATVCQIVRDGGNYWAGSKIFLNNSIDLSTMWHISMKVYTTAPIGTRIKLELENSGGRTNLDKLTTVSGAWETISWNFDGQANDYDRIQMMFDFGNIGDGTSTSTFLFDDVQQISGPAIPDPLPTTLPIDFENSVVTTDFINFFGAVTTVIPNPQIDTNNPSATVGQFLRSGGAGYMRSKLALTDYIENMSTIGTISMKVYTDAPIGTILKFKLESSPPNQFGKEQDALTTVSGEWATYTWDLSNADSPIYDVLTLMLGYNGSNDASANATFLFDDIEIKSNVLSNGIDQSLNIVHVNAFPNPTKDVVTISSKNKIIKNITLYNLLGKEIIKLQPNSLSTIIDISHFAKGIYIAKISTSSGIGSLKLLKE
ncbi:T9SS type A sorting domain-containing protein [Gaetbulibacter aquiaggeris]|uniref:T9SS type A sorting domain-containing protein n=1 Tax=Gaetbulibacter aquiaggeris TaxID=1735373 RepID=A0ABW7MSE6_9FLAO